MCAGSIAADHSSKTAQHNVKSLACHAYMQGKLYIITEYASNGNLHDYIKKHRVSIGLQVAAPHDVLMQIWLKGNQSALLQSLCLFSSAFCQRLARHRVAMVASAGSHKAAITRGAYLEAFHTGGGSVLVTHPFVMDETCLAIETGFIRHFACTLLHSVSHSCTYSHQPPLGHGFGISGQSLHGWPRS